MQQRAQRVKGPATLEHLQMRLDICGIDKELESDVKVFSRESAGQSFGLGQGRPTCHGFRRRMRQHSRAHFWNSSEEQI